MDLERNKKYQSLVEALEKQGAKKEKFENSMNLLASARTDFDSTMCPCILL